MEKIFLLYAHNIRIFVLYESTAYTNSDIRISMYSSTFSYNSRIMCILCTFSKMESTEPLFATVQQLFCIELRVQDTDPSLTQVYYASAFVYSSLYRLLTALNINVVSKQQIFMQTRVSEILWKIESLWKIVLPTKCYVNHRILHIWYAFLYHVDFAQFCFFKFPANE